MNEGRGPKAAPATATLPRAPQSLPLASDIATPRCPAADPDAMADEAAAIIRRAEGDDRAWRDGFSFGYECGRAEGHQAGGAAADLLWIEALGVVRAAASSATHAELELRRAEDPTDPCPTRCGRCSRCVRSRAWWANGGRDYPGGAA